MAEAALGGHISLFTHFFYGFFTPFLVFNSFIQQFLSSIHVKT